MTDIPALTHRLHEIRAPLADAARLCAAFHRDYAHVEGGTEMIRQSVQALDSLIGFMQKTWMEREAALRESERLGAEMRGVQFQTDGSRLVP